MRKYLAAFVISLSACAQLGIAPADTFNKKVAAGYSTVAAVADTANALAAQGKLSKADAEKVHATIDGSIAGLAAAEGIAKTDPAAADNRLTAIIAALQAAQAILASKGK